MAEPLDLSIEYYTSWGYEKRAARQKIEPLVLEARLIENSTLFSGF